MLAEISVRETEERFYLCRVRQLLRKTQGSNCVENADTLDGEAVWARVGSDLARRSVGSPGGKFLVQGRDF